MLHISDAEHLGEYRLRVAFNDGREGIADLRPMVFGERRMVFEPLKDLSGFRQFFIEHGTLCWAFRDDESLRGLFDEWGYVQTEVAV